MPNNTTDTKVDELIINTLTKAQYDDLVANNQIEANQLYLTKDEDYYMQIDVTYGTTTYAQITSALGTKQEPVCNYNSYQYTYAGNDGTYYYFTCAINNEIKYVRVNNANTWSNGTASLQTTISDLGTIRANASLGASAVQPSDLATVATTGDYDDLINKPTITSGTVTSVQVQATSPVQSSTSTAQSTSLNTTISLADAYGDTKNPYGSKTKNYVLAAPTSAAGAPSFRALDKSDIPDLSSTYLTSHQSIKSIKSDNTAAQSTSSSEAIAGSGTINLHKIAKTGTFSDLLSKPTSISGYGITDAYTKTEVDGMISSVYKPAGSVAFASLPTLSSNVLGNVYNVTDAFTTTADFVEGAGKSYPAGTNVVVIEPTSGTYKFDVLAGFVDLSGYVPTSRKVNGKALSADITLSASDVGAQASGNYISYTNNTATVAGTSKTVSKTNPKTLFVPNGLIMGGTAQAAGLVTRGICGTTEPTSTGGATKDNLYLNYDGSNTYSASRQVVIQAGTVGTHYGNNLYQYAAARGDAVKNYADATYVPQTRTINSKALSSNITLSASDVGAVSTTDGVTAVVAGTTANKIDVTKNGSTSTITVDNVATATKATQDASGNVITETYATKTEVEDTYACTFVDWSD